MRFPISVVVAAGIVAISATLMLVRAQESDMRATVDKPATVPISNRTNENGRLTAGERPRLVLTIIGFEPSPDGPVEIVVNVRCGGADREIGRFAIYPYVAFSASDPSRVQRFGFNLPNDLACDRPRSAMVHLVPGSGDGKGASILIGRASLE